MDGHDVVGKRRQELAQRIVRHQVEEVRILDRLARRNEVRGLVVDEGDGSTLAAAQFGNGRPLGHFGGQQRVVETQRVEMSAARGAVAVKHRRQKYDLDLLAKLGQRIGGTVRYVLPVGLSV